MDAAGFVPASDRGRVLAALRRQLGYVLARSPFYASLFGAHGLGAPALADLGDLGRFPFTTKSMLRQSQADAPPLGRHAAAPLSEVIRVHASTGTTGTPSWVGVTAADSRSWTATTAAALRAQGLCRDDVLVHGAGLTMFVGGLPVRDAVEDIGATMIPVGTGASAKALLAMDSFDVTVLHSTPSYARYLAEYLRESGRDPKDFGLRRLMVGGEPGGGEPAFREHIEREWGARVTEGLGNADMAPILFAERPGAAGMRLTGGDHVFVELIDPDTGTVLPPEPGVSGELVYTALARECCPLVRFRTRDRVHVTGLDSDGAPLIRCVGRTDDMLIVLGVNVFPAAVRDVVQTLHPRTSGAMQVVLERAGPRVEPPLRLDVEWGAAPGDHDTLRRLLESLIRNRLSVPAEVNLVPPGSLERSEMKTRLTRVSRVSTGG
ncbi:phenylacetate--CoA ligase family protein [Qaidamihabitans albus]|uniref:phenylacetate--CoA ligase family protein n=1 Tax=Qaidamihabitans albus TaxID=2795733 RepID=UPI0018F1E209|nr:phenylacetate--CoA ligase family protein [Qaidamihabitans albus]